MTNTFSQQSRINSPTFITVIQELYDSKKNVNSWHRIIQVTRHDDESRASRVAYTSHVCAQSEKRGI